MTPAEYLLFVHRQSSHPQADRETAAIFGLMAEAGEVAGLYERALRAGQPPVDPAALALELGDCLFYWALGRAPMFAERRLEYDWSAPYASIGASNYTVEKDIRTGRLSNTATALESIHFIATTLGLTIEEIAARNVAKLQKRNAQRSIDDRSRRTE